MRCCRTLSPFLFFSLTLGTARGAQIDAPIMSQIPGMIAPFLEKTGIPPGLLADLPERFRLAHLGAHRSEAWPDGLSG